MEAITDPKELLDALNEYAIALLGYDKGREAIPHIILAHGFGKWLQLLQEQFPCFKWGGEREAKGHIFLITGEMFLILLLFDRFFLQLSGMSAFNSLSEEEKKKLEEQGWQEYCED
jgi:hypothetical protein